MFKCCSCHRKPSRRTSEEDDEDDSDRDTDDSSSSSSSEEDEKDEEEEEREIEAELAKKFKCQTQEANVVGRKDRTSKEDSDEEDDDEEDDDDEDESSSVEKVVVEVNGDLRDDSSENGFDRDAIKEDVGEIVNCAVKIAQRICTERLEKITEETPEGSPTINGIPNGVSNVVADNKIDDTVKSKPELQKMESEESEEVVTVIEDEEGEYEIIEDVKNEKVDKEASKTHQIEEKIIEELINELNEEADNVQELKEIVETPTDNQQQPSETNNEETEISAYTEESNKSPIIERFGLPIEEPELDFSLRTRDPAEEASAEPIEEKPIEKSIEEPAEELPKETLDEPKEESPPPPYCEVEIIDEIKKSELYKIEGSLRENICKAQKEILEVNVEQNVCPVEEAAVEETILDSINGDLLNIPPPATPPPEEAADFEKISESSTETFPTPPPIDFDMPESSQDDETDQECNDIKTPGPPVPPWEEDIEMPPQVQDKLDRLLPKLERYDWKPSSPGSKSLPSPPSPDSPSETGCETEVESKSSGDEQVTRMKPHGIKAAFVQRVQRTIDDVPDDDAEDSVFETVSLVKDPEIVKDIPPRPGCEHDEREEHLEELVNRLESVTKRLEQVSSQQPAIAPVQTSEIAVQTKSPSPERSLSIESASEQSSSSSRESTHSSSLASVVEVAKSMSVLGYEDLVAGPLHEFLQLSQKIGGDVAAHGKLVDKAFQIQLQFLKTASSRAAPTSQSEQVSLLGPTSAQIQEIQEYREKHRGSPFFNHLSAISESIPALGWVAVSPTPAPYVKEMNDAGQFYTNRVLKDWKEKDKTHVEWCKAWVKTLTDLQQFVRQHHTTGLVWAKAGSVPAGGVPPPPPPCMMPMAEPAPLINDDRSALFAEINQGENITKNLKKVTSEMQTHKNHNLRTGPAPFKAPVVSNSSGGKATLPANVPIDKPPVFTRDGKKWLVEYHKGNKNLLIDNVEMNNVVYMFRCQDSNLVIKGKINSVVMDSCRKSSVVVDSVVASIEFVNCQSVQMQVLGKVPTISVDKTDGCQMYLNKDTLQVELITSKSSEMNVMVPIGNGDYTEYPVPEQFKTVITDKGLATVAVDSLG